VNDFIDQDASIRKIKLDGEVVTTQGKRHPSEYPIPKCTSWTMGMAKE